MVKSENVSLTFNVAFHDNAVQQQPTDLVGRVEYNETGQCLVLSDVDGHEQWPAELRRII